MSDDPIERYRDANTVKIPFVLVPSGGDRVAALDGLIVDDVAIPIQFEPTTASAMPGLDQPQAFAQPSDQAGAPEPDEPTERRIPGSLAPIDR